MTYVVRIWTENNNMIRKTFKYKKSAIKFAMKMSEIYYGGITFIEYDENNQIISESAF